MLKAYKINISKFTLLLVAISLMMSGVLLFNVGINIRPIHILLPVLFLILIITKFRWIRDEYRKIKRQKLFILFVIYLSTVLYSTLSIALEPISGFKLWIALLVNASLALVFLGVLKEKQITSQFIQQLSYFSIILICAIIVIQLLLSAIGLYQPHMHGDNGFFGLGRPTAFFGDPGWLAYWFILFSLIIFENKRVNRIGSFEFNFFLLALAIGLLISQSRISIGFIFFNFYILVLHKKITRKVLLSLIVLLSIIFLSIMIYFGAIQIPENLYYDIVKLKANPRIYDTITIYTEYIKSGNIWFGNGLGSLDRLVEFYPWRNFTNSHNVIFLQILNDSGIVGVLFVLYFIYKLFKKLKTKIGKIMYVEFIILLCFHNIFPYFQLFWFLLAIIFVIDKKYDQKLIFK